MPVTALSLLPDGARVWVFGSDRALTPDEAQPLLVAVDAFLAQWKAHGEPLRSAREWTDDRFLIIGVDPTAEQASGCSIDGLFRHLRELERIVDARLVGGGRIFYRDEEGTVHGVTRPEFTALALRGGISPAVTVFDTTVTSARDWRERFVQPAANTWVAELLPVS